MINPVIVPFIIFGYLLQMVELIFFPLPSDFTTYNILQKQNPVFTASKSTMAVLILGTVISMITFLVPGLIILFPESRTLLHFINLEFDGLHVFSVLLIIAGSLLTLFGVLKISKLKRYKTEIGIIQSGIFRFTRNPITLGLNFLVIGFFLALPALEMLGGCIIYIINAHIRVRMEEQQLQLNHGKVFKNYKNNVPRYMNIKPVFDLF